MVVLPSQWALCVAFFIGFFPRSWASHIFFYFFRLCLITQGETKHCVDLPIIRVIKVYLSNYLHERVAAHKRPARRRAAVPINVNKRQIFISKHSR